jgi:hypothetical protein
VVVVGGQADIGRSGSVQLDVIGADAESVASRRKAVHVPRLGEGHPTEHLHGAGRGDVRVDDVHLRIAEDLAHEAHAPQHLGQHVVGF